MTYDDHPILLGLVIGVVGCLAYTSVRFARGRNVYDAISGPFLPYQPIIFLMIYVSVYALRSEVFWIAPPGWLAFPILVFVGSSLSYPFLLPATVLGGIATWILHRLMPAERRREKPVLTVTGTVLCLAPIFAAFFLPLEA